MEFISLERFSGSALLPFITTATMGFVAWLVYKLFYKPYNLFKDYAEFGYNIGSENNDIKRSIIKHAMQRRKIGELPPPYPNSWYAILESDQLLGSEVKEVYALGQKLVAWRSEINGKAFVSDVYSPHPGADAGGVETIQEDFLCLRNDLEMTKEKLSGQRLRHVVETNGFIHIWHHADGLEPTWVPEGVEDVVSGKWKYHGRSEFQVTCHIQEIPENGADVAHLDALHDSPALFFDRMNPLGKIVGSVLKHIWSVDWNINDDPGKKHESVGKVIHELSLFGDRLMFCRVIVAIKQIGAGLVEMRLSTPVGEGILFQSVTPIEPMLQRIVHRFYSESRFIHPFSMLVLRSEAVQISRDIEIWNRKCYLRKPELVKEDYKIKQFRRWFSQFYSAAK